MTPTPRPFHQTARAGESARRLLLLSVHFPPSKSVGGVRWQKMARFAAERGWGLDVVCLDPSSLDAADPSRLADLPDDVRVYGVPGIVDSPYAPLVRALGAARDAVRPRRGTVAAGASSGGVSAAAAPGETGVAREAALAQPWLSPSNWPRMLLTAHYLSAATRWAHAAAAVARAVATPAHRAVISSGPPHEVHVAARRLAAALGVPFVPDLRDPWSLNERVATAYGTRLYFARAGRDERRVVRDAAFVVCNTEQATRALAAHHPAHAGKIVTVMNGSDAVPERAAAAPGGALLVVYAGAVYAGRDPRVLFGAAARLIREQGLTPDDLRFEFAGPVDAASASIDAVAAAAGIAPFVTYRGVLTRAQTDELLARAHLLVSLPQEHDTAVPSKIFEYAAQAAWMLVMAPAHSASAAVLAGTEASVVAPDDEAALADVLRDRLARHRRGEVPLPAGRDGRFDRRRQAERFLDRLDVALADAASTRGA